MIRLRDYQLKIVQEILKRKNILVVAPMGAGKTVSTLMALSTLISQSRVKNILIIAPKRVAMSVWAQEAEKYGLPLNIRYCETPATMSKFLATPASHHIMVASVTRISSIPAGWDCVVVDESTMFKHKSSQRSKEARRICNKVPYRILLTGTPIHNGYEGLFHQCFLLDGGRALGKTLGAFRLKYMREKYRINGVTVIYEMDPTKIPVIMQDVKPIVHVVNSNAKLPPLLYKTIRLDLPKSVQQQYEAFEDANILLYTEKEPYATEKTLVAFCKTALGAKLRQVASGTVYTDPKLKAYSKLHGAKIEACMELLESLEKGVLIAYNFRSELEELKKAFPEARELGTAKDIDDWNAGKIRIALVHPASVGHGLNLQFGGHAIIWYTLTYDAELYAQLNKRLHRSGQVEPVSVIHLVAKNTIDEKVLKIIEKKEQTATNFLQV